jgi:Ubiquitin carboxyl-terminal hydrolase
MYTPRRPAVVPQKRSLALCSAALTGEKHRDRMPSMGVPPGPITRQDIEAKQCVVRPNRTYGGANRPGVLRALSLTPVSPSSTPLNSTSFVRDDFDEASKPPITLSKSLWSPKPAHSTFMTFFGPRVPLGSLEGFRNTGNTCYLNSILSALLHLPPFVRALQHDEIAALCSAGAHKRSKTAALKALSQIVDLTEDVDSDLEADVVAALQTESSVSAPIFQALRRILTKRLGGGVSDVINPIDFKEVRLLIAVLRDVVLESDSFPLAAQAVANAAHKFDAGRQEDAHEFMLYCLAEV